MPSPDVTSLETLLAGFEREMRAQKRRGCALGCAFSLLVCGAFCLWGLALEPEENVAGAAVFCLLAALLCAGLALRRAGASARMRRAAQALTEQEDVRLVGPLLMARSLPGRPLRRSVEQALIRLLPRMQASDAPLLGSDHCWRLHDLLYDRNEPLARATLRALEQVGDSLSVWYVEALTGTAPQSGGFPLSDRPEVQAAARECLPALRQRLKQGRLRQTLLRPAAAPGSPAETLLRPAEGAPSGDVERLLRPVQPLPDADDSKADTSLRSPDNSRE